MAADYRLLSRTLSGFYDFTGKSVLYVGAGGRQFLDPAVRTRKVIAIDRDANSLAGLNLETVAADFEEVTLTGDVVYLEFCLHEMPDPLRALRHSRTLAPDTVVFDHTPESEWIFLGAEDEQVRRSAAAQAEFGIRRHMTLRNEQRFQDYAELVAKVKGQGRSRHRARPAL